MAEAGLTVARAVVGWLADIGCREAFLLPGAQIDPLAEALAVSPVRPVVAQHELGAAYMADAVARLEGRPAVCVLAGGPGLAYAVAAAITARVDHQPVLFISGAPEVLDGSSFQDVGACGGRDQALMAAALDHSRMTVRVDEVDETLAWAAERLRALPASPVHLCIPLGLQSARLAAPLQGRTATAAERQLRLELLQALLRAARVGVLAGPGCVAEGVSEMLVAAVERHALPVMTSCDAKGLLDERHPLCLGPVGYAASLRSRAALAELDALLVLGAEPCAREADGNSVVEACAAPMLIQTYRPTDAVGGAELVAACREVLLALLAEPAPEPELARRRAAWLAALSLRPNRLPAPLKRQAGPVDLAHLILALREELPADAPLFCDAGLFRRFAGHYWTAYRPRSFLTAVRTAPMGWAIAGCVGAAAREPRRPAFALAGDGCMRLMGAEIATAAHIGAPAKIVISDNGLLGNVHLRSRATAAEALARSPAVDWVGFARALGASGHAARSETEFRRAMRLAIAEPGPSLVAVATSVRSLVDQPAASATRSETC